MEMRKVTSFQTMQSLGNKEICILVVHDDPRYRDILAKVLRCCGRYKVLKQTISDALSTIRERKDRLNLFVTDIDRSNPNGFVIWQYIEKEFKLDIRSIAPSEGTKLAIDLTSEGNLHFLKSLSVNEFESLWQYACAEESGKATGGQEKPLWDENAFEVSLGNMSLFPEATQYDQKRKRRESQETTEKSYATSDGSAKAKKPRVIWNDWLHHKFVEAIKQLGVEPHKAMPKKIKDLMNVKDLSRESVASHLQKYRQTLLRAEKVMQSTGSFFGSNLTTHLKQNRFSSSRFAQNFNSSQGNTLYLNQQPNLIISHQPGSDYSSLLHPEASTSTSNMRHEHQLTGTYPFGHSFSPPDPIAQNNTNLFDFGSAQSYSQTGLAQLDSGCVPGINGQSSNAVGAYVGYRLAGNGLSVETGKVVVLGDDENGTDKVSLSAGGSWNESFEQISLSPGGSWDESLVQTTLASGDYIPQQQPSQPPVHAVAHDLDNLGAEDEVGRLLDTTGSTSSQFFWDDDFNDALFDNTD